MLNPNYYIWASYRRKLLDQLQIKYQHLYHGSVLDIGGRDLGRFEKPKSKVTKWIFADIEPRNKPDIVLDVTNMRAVDNNSIDVVNAIELFEHVDNAELGVKECYRVLKENGTFIFSMPYLSPIHKDPYDYNRFTEYKLKRILNTVGFRIKHKEITGLYFVVLADMFKTFIVSLPIGLRYPGYFLLPLLDLIAKLDKTNFTKKSKALKNFHGGYFIVAQK